MMKKRTQKFEKEFNVTYRELNSHWKKQKKLCMDEPDSRLHTAEERLSKLEEWPERHNQSTVERNKIFF